MLGERRFARGALPRLLPNNLRRFASSGSQAFGPLNRNPASGAGNRDGFYKASYEATLFMSQYTRARFAVPFPFEQQETFHLRLG